MVVSVVVVSKLKNPAYGHCKFYWSIAGVSLISKEESCKVENIQLL